MLTASSTNASVIDGQKLVRSIMKILIEYVAHFEEGTLVSISSVFQTGKSRINKQVCVMI